METVRTRISGKNSENSFNIFIIIIYFKHCFIYSRLSDYFDIKLKYDQSWARVTTVATI